MDGYPLLSKALRDDHHSYRYDLTTKSAFITRENINDLIREAGFAGEIGLLSIDVDGNDYWIWEALDAVRPVICICEYNTVFGDLHPVSIPYDPRFSCGQSQPSRLYFGASIAAFSSLATRKGYKFLGTTMAGNDAFFIREDYASRFDDALRNIVAVPTKCRTPVDASGQLPWAEGYGRLKAIAGLPLVNTETGESVTLGGLGSVYSDDWLQQISGAPEK